MLLSDYTIASIIDASLKVAHKTFNSRIETEDKSPTPNDVSLSGGVKLMYIERMSPGGWRRLLLSDTATGGPQRRGPRRASSYCDRLVGRFWCPVGRDRSREMGPAGDVTPLSVKRLRWFDSLLSVAANSQLRSVRAILLPKRDKQAAKVATS